MACVSERAYGYTHINVWQRCVVDEFHTKHDGFYARTDGFHTKKDRFYAKVTGNGGFFVDFELDPDHLPQLRAPEPPRLGGG